ncbi:hypothetical protein L3X38_037186 [Prunus dulcis]|uniref:Reverse transcriptase/retrotransposon-derived protein RNase H-like domain-containing protein n=1 Tax=Prunus dulcis TaxID=3755 RepID=A0AAD4V453_PRUDU|nr:hypothetical protein L3X38_037186 [Prunus dulcis]
MKSPSTVKEIQSLTGRAAALNRFLSRSTEKCRPFFKALKKEQRDKLDEECKVAFQNLKTYLTSPPLLLKPVLGEDLFVYLAMSNSAVSSALIREELGAQHPVFYTSKALLDEETRYSKLKKLILALLVSTRKLRPYY